MEGGEPDRVLRVSRNQGWEVLVELTQQVLAKTGFYWEVQWAQEKARKPG